MACSPKASESQHRKAPARGSEVVNLLQGRRADGEEIAGRQAYKVGAGKDRITYVDFTFSAPKSVSVAMALAPTDAERHMIVGAHRDAWPMPGSGRVMPWRSRPYWHGVTPTSWT